MARRDGPGDGVAHGTYAGSQAHRKQGTPVCGECRAAAAAYMRERRADPAVRDAARRRAAARDRALSRLARLHPGLYRALYEEELGRRS